MGLSVEYSSEFAKKARRSAGFNVNPKAYCPDTRKKPVEPLTPLVTVAEI